MEKLDAIIVDLDGTMALKGDRDPYSDEGVLEDLPNIPVIETVEALVLSKGYRVIYTSGRRESAREDTEEWLRRHTSFGYDMLLMRPGNMRTTPDDILKMTMYSILIEPYYNVKVVFDDRDKVVEVWREQAKLPCFQVAPGGF